MPYARILSVISKFFDSSVFEGTLGDLFLRGLRSSIFDGARVDLFFLVFDLRPAPADMASNMFVMAIAFFEALPFNILFWYCVMNVSSQKDINLTIYILDHRRHTHNFNLNSNSIKICLCVFCGLVCRSSDLYLFDMTHAI